MSSIIYFNKEILGGLSRDEFIEKLKKSLHGRVSECYIFGSFASNAMIPSSDVDIILIQETDIPFLDRGKQFLDIYEIGPKLDLLIYTPYEFKNLLQENTGFWKSVKEDLIRIF
jgi:predicted nucleotidyltransferase